MFNTIPCMYIAALSGVARISETGGGGGGGQTNSPVSARAIILLLYSNLLSGFIAPQTKKYNGP